MKPNILMIMSDQHGRPHSSAYGHKLVHSPNIDFLAKNGVLFENSYCNSPICVPSRMSFMTGKRVQDIEIWDNNAILSSDIPTWAQLLNERDYEVVLSGRMHFRGKDQLHGFKAQIARDPQKNGSIPNWDNYKKGILPTKHRFKDLPVSTGTCERNKLDDEREEAAIKYIKQKKNDEDPWGLVVGFTAPHRPWTVEEKYMELCQLDDIEIPELSEDHLHNLPFAHKLNRKIRQMPEETFSEEKTKKAKRGYYASISRIDEKIGNLLQSLEETGQLNNTLIIYTSDHGEMLGEHGLWMKSSLYEQSVGIPLVFYWKDHLPQGLRLQEVVSLLDVSATLVDIGGNKSDINVAGDSLLNLVKGEKITWKDRAIVEYYATWTDRPLAMIRKGKYKLNYAYNKPPELYDLNNDPGEFDNLADGKEYRKIKQNLISELFTYWNPEKLNRKVLKSQKERINKYPEEEL